MNSIYALFITAAEGDTLPQLPTFAQYGLIGILFAMVVGGVLLVPKYAYERERDRADALETEVKRLNALIQDRHVPALESASKAISDSTELVTDLRREIIDSRRRERDIER